MMSPIAAFLTDFGAPIALNVPPSSASDVEVAREAEALRQTIAIEEARRAAEADAEARMGVVHAAAIAELSARHAAELESERQRWIDEVSQPLADRLGSAMSALEDRLAANVADILETFLPALTAAKAVTDLRAAVSTLLADNEALTLRVSGPADLLDAIGKRGALPASAVLEPSQDPDVVVRAGNTTVEARLKPWADGLRSELGAET